MASDLFYLPGRSAINLDGFVASGAVLSFFATGTSTPQNVFSDSGLTQSLGATVTANAAGKFPTIYLDSSKVYRVRCVLSGVVLFDDDPYYPGSASEATTELLAASTAAIAAADRAEAAAGDAGYYSTIAAGAAATSAPNTFISDEDGYLARYDDTGALLGPVIGTPQILTLTQAEAMTIPTAIIALTTVGISSETRKLPVHWRRVASEPAHGFKFQDNGGAWFEGDVTANEGVPVWAFGAHGETSDEFPAIKLAATAANYLEVPCIFDPVTTYIIDQDTGLPAAQLRFTPLDGKKFILDGRGCTLKYKDNTLDGTSGSFYHLIGVYMGSTYGNASAVVPLVNIKNFTLDGNLRGQPSPLSPSNYEQCASLRISTPTNDARIDFVLLENLRHKDPIADCELIGQSSTLAFDDDGDGVAETAPIRRALIRKSYYGEKTGARAALAIGSGVSDLTAIGCFAENTDSAEKNSLETEFSTIGTQKCRFKFIDCVYDDLEIGGKTTQGAEQVWVETVNCTFRRFALVVYSAYRDTGSILPISLVNTWQPFIAEFNGTTFKHAVYDDGSGNIIPRGINLGMTPASQNLRWTETGHCRHLIDGTLSGAVGTNIALNVSASITHATLSRFEITLDGTEFDARWPTSIDAYNAGDFKTSRCIFGGTYRAVVVGSSSTYAGRWTSNNDDFTKVTATTVQFLGNVSTYPDLVRIEGGQWPSFAIGTTGSFANDITGLCNRRRQVSAAPTGGGIFGDEAILSPVGYAAASSTNPIRWLASVTSATNALWRAVETKP